MVYLILLLAFFLPFTAMAIAGERKNFSIDDVIAGFKTKKLFYYEAIFENGKYSRTFNKCLGSRPADFNWMKQHCKKNPEFKNTFECSEDIFTRVWFVYESQEYCEEMRELMKDKMDAVYQ
jgi:hypothetical protein